ncbi:MAG: hypothetical protein IT262_09255 [Saprospiraceae bacterium]|nr:hypothetical protein [Saprospiraceae bacterium]
MTLQKNTLLLFVLLSVATLCAQAQTPHTPVKGSTERKALLDALRPAIEKTLGIEVVFEVRKLNVLGNFAYGDLVPRHKNGQPIDYTQTNIDPEQLEAFDDWACVLWEMDKKGKWKVKTFLLGATDVPYLCWWNAFGAPKAVFPETVDDCSTE